MIKKKNGMLLWRNFKCRGCRFRMLKGFQSLVSDFYYIPSIPKTLLLDRNGKIIGKDYRGNSLEKKLEELLGK